MKLLAYWLLLGGLVFGRLAAAQTAPTGLVCPVLSMSSSALGKAMQAVEAAIYQRIIFPPVCLRDEVNGSVFIELTITPGGAVRQVRIVKALHKPFDAAVVKAAGQLPHFKPRPTREGVTSFVVGISWEKEVASLPANPPAAHQPTRRRNPNP